MSSELVTDSACSHVGTWPRGLAYRAWKMRAVRLFVVVFIFAVSFMLIDTYGRLRYAGRDATVAGTSATGIGAVAQAAHSWTCSMHPQIQLPGDGPCPICFMDLIPVQAGAGNTRLPELSLSERARILARVETAAVEYREVEHEIHLVGKVSADETRIRYISSYVPGRIDRLLLDSTGIFARAGDPVAEIYSPELLVVQRGYRLTDVSRGSDADPVEDVAAWKRDARFAEAVRRKLLLWGVPADEVLRNTDMEDNVRIHAPADGWVLERLAYEGMYVELGTRLFTLADLRVVWVMLDAYELDFPFLRYGQRVEFEVEAFPGRRFEGQITYIDPRLGDVSRTVKVRIRVPNDDLQLRPGMFVRATVCARLNTEGEAIEPSVAGKWICPMHPEVVREGAGRCAICEVELASAESLGFADAESSPGKVLAIPQTAVLLTGRRAVVYVENDGPDGAPVYEGRVVELGPRAGDWYVVRTGLAGGERVATRGAFLIDSALQIQARPSMMQFSDDMSRPIATNYGQHPAASSENLRAVHGAGYHRHMRPAVDALLEFAEALSADQPDAAGTTLATLHNALERATPDGLAGDDCDLFRQRVTAVKDALPPADTRDIEVLRAQLPSLNAALESYLHTFGHNHERPLVRMFCPMAIQNRGAHWLQVDDRVRNPYFGRKMYRCGETRGTIAADGMEVR